MIEIVPFSKHHLSGVVDVILPIQQLEFNIPITLDAQPDLLDIPGFYQKGSGNFWVALHGSEVVGTIALLDIGNNQGALRKMFVKTQFRGSKQGIAHKLLRVLLDWCELHNIYEIYLGTTARFLAAHRFYEKNGFSEIQQSELPISFPVMSVDTKFYKYVLANSDPNMAHLRGCLKNVPQSARLRKSWLKRSVETSRCVCKYFRNAVLDRSAHTTRSQQSRL